MSGCSAWRSGRGGSNSNKHVAFFTGRHLRRGDSREGDPHLTWTRMEDTRHTEAVGIRIILGGGWLTQGHGDRRLVTSPLGVSK